MKKTNSVFQKEDFLSIVLLTGLVLIGKLPVLSPPLPAVWDEINYLDGIVKIIQEGLNPFAVYWSYHPPFVMWPTAVLVQALGNILLTTKLVTIFFAIISVSFSYLLVKEITKKRFEAFLSGVLLFISPLFFAQAGMFQAEVPLAALTIVVVYWYIKQNWLLFGLFGGALVLSKEPGVVIFGIILFFEIIFGVLRKNKFYPKSEKALAFIFPFLVFINWMVINKIVYRWFLWPENVSIFTNFQGLLKTPMASRILRLREIYAPVLGLQKVGHGNWLIHLFILIGLFSQRKNLFQKGEAFLKFLGVAFFIIFLFPLTFGLGNPFARYNLATYPLIFSLLGVIGSLQNYPKVPAGRVFMVFLIPLMVHFWKADASDWESNLSYLKTFPVRQELARVIDREYSSFSILTHWPLSRELQSSYLGYVNKDNQLVFYYDEREKKNLLDWLGKIDYLLAGEYHPLYRLALPYYQYYQCLSVERKFESFGNKILLFKVDKACLSESNDR